MYAATVSFLLTDNQFLKKTLLEGGATELVGDDDIFCDFQPWVFILFLFLIRQNTVGTFFSIILYNSPMKDRIDLQKLV